MSTQSPSPPHGTAAASRGAVADWIERAESTQVPVFSATVADITSIVDSSRSSAKDLADAIGRDAGLTARLLKLANSPLFCQQGRQARTINSAVVLLGFNAVRDLAITLSIVDQVQNAPGREVLVDTLLQAFHGAGQARALALRAPHDGDDEVFLAGLLSRLGELVFLSSQTPELEALTAHLTPGKLPDADTQRALVGFALQDITAALVEQWQLGPLLRDVAHRRDDDPRVAGISLSVEIAALVDSERWAALTPGALGVDPEAQDLVKRHAALAGGTEAESLALIAKAAAEAAEIAKRFGVTLTPRSAAKAELSASDRTPVPSTATNPARQVAVLAEMTALMQQPVTLDQLMQVAIEGIVAGAGLPRVFFALLTPDRKALLIKHQRGEFPALPKLLSLGSNRPLAEALEEDALRVFDRPWTLFGDPAFRTPGHSLLQRVMVGKTSIGLLYADGGVQGPQLAAASTEAVVLFVQQVGLSLLSGKRAVP